MGMRLVWIVLLVTILPPAEAQSSPAQSLWASLGVGGAAKGMVLLGAASYSRGLAVASARVSWAGALIGPSVDSRALLAGVRTAKGPRFALAAIGIGRSRSKYTRDAATGTNPPSRTTFAFQLQVHPNFDVTPLGLAILGEAGTGDSSYLGAVITLDLGWFGSSR
jgi:hypothetical protein